MAIDTSSKAYKSLLDKGYTADQIQQMSGQVASGQSAKDVIAGTKVGAQPAKQTSPSVQQASINKTNEINTRVQNTQNNINDLRNQLNSMSSQVAQNNSRNSQVGTGDVADMPQQPNAQLNTSNADALAKAWEGLDYETQQKKLNSIAGLKEALAKKGITSKTQPTQTTTTTKPTTTTQQRTTQTPKQEQWDYQDNSQARMNQIADNLKGYRQTMPQLFDDMSAFYNFFIKDKGRSQDQIDFLWDYYNRVQKYGKYDNMSPDQLGTGIANGDIPEDYLNTLKTEDPQKYQEVMAAKQNREDTIKNESFLNDAATMAGIEGWESEPSSIQYAKQNQIWMDEDNNGVDDRREHYASEEEKGYQKQIADLNAANLDIDNTVKHTYDDLVKAYPGATKATLMAMAQDRNSDLLREKENNLVELTRLQGYVGYMQSERQEMNAAGADSIAQLQKNLGMYYDYSPEGMAELAQAQYGATNITLDQADSGNETQKQMALDRVLSDYYDKYGSIIQRPKSQVINDVIAYSKKNGIGLAQALQENFVTPLKAKPEYKSLSSNLEGSKYKFSSYEGADGIKHTIRYNEETGDWEEIFGDEAEGYNSGLIGGVSDFISNLITLGYKIASNGGSGGSKIRSGGCGTVVNDYLEDLGESIRLTEANDIKSYATSKTPSEGAITYFDGTQSRATPATKEHGHVGIVVGDNGDTITVLESNEGTGLRYNTYKKSDVTGYYKPNKKELGYGENPMTNMISLIRSKGNLTSDGKKDIDFASKAYQLMYELASDGDIDYLIKSPEGQKFISNLKSASFTQNDDNATGIQVFNALKNGIADQRNLKTVNKLINIIELKLRKTSGAAIAASEWNSNFDMLLPGVNEKPDVSLDKYRTFEKTYLVDYFNSAGNNIKGYKYIPLFEEGSPYYKVVSTTDNKDKKTTSGGTKINEINWTQYTGGKSGGYSTLDLIDLWQNN